MFPRASGDGSGFWSDAEWIWWYSPRVRGWFFIFEVVNLEFVALLARAGMGRGK